MKNLKNKKIAIVGGGPGGLTLARLLQQKGANVKVYERDANRDARSKGATLDLHEESGLLALSEAGLMDAFRANYRPGADLMRIMDKNGRIIRDEHEHTDMDRSRSGKDRSHSGEDQTHSGKDQSRPEIDRGPLINILLDSLEPGTVIWNSRFLSISPDNLSRSPEDGPWKLEFQNGPDVHADIVIGADGANSKIRGYITSIKPFYSGVTIVEGAVNNSQTASPEIHNLLKGGKIFAMGDDKTLIVSSKGDGSLTFYAGFHTDENRVRDCGIDFSDKIQVLSWFRTEYSGWDKVWLELFENASSPFAIRPQYCMPLDQHWEALPNLTMLGDAAHLMPPYAGEGVNMAMLDALELANCLTSEDFPDIHSAIAAYEVQMRARASETASDTLESTAALHSPNAISYMMGISN